MLREGQPLTLTPKAFDVLAMLVRRSGSLVEKDELFSEVWPNTIVEESSLSQKIYQLRRALDDGSGQEYIQTVPRHGYRFVAEVREVLQPTVATSEHLQTDDHEQTIERILDHDDISEAPISTPVAATASRERNSHLVSTRLARLAGEPCRRPIRRSIAWPYFPSEYWVTIAKMKLWDLVWLTL